MAFTEEKIYHLKDYVECISELGERYRLNEQTPPVLWSRGHRCQDWVLKPTLLRNVPLDQKKHIKGNASGRALQEEMRRQHYIARNYHFLSKDPDTRLDWMELMQHHGVHTRLLDWSESVFHSLLFSLECFFDGSKYRKKERIESSPCVWVFEPIGWNRKVLKKLLKESDVIRSCTGALLAGTNNMRKKVILNRFEELKNVAPDYMKMQKASHLEGIFNLSAIEEEIKKFRKEELEYLLKNGEYYYCLFFLLNQVYLTTKTWELDQVMPLAIVESYHSERIRAQKGAFTIFPYYKETSEMTNLEKVGIELDAMENMHNGSRFLHKILICNQDEVAFEIMNAGLNVSWLYPEMPVVANAIENRRIIF